jgi:CubicO group peptidase (beta-lactamase class C family)
MNGYDAARLVVDDAIRARVFPAATIEVGSGSAPMWTDALGTLTFDRGAPASTLETPFDLASLTKPMATTTIVMELVRTGVLRLDEPVSTFFPDWRGEDRAAVTVRDLLEHASGLPARLVDPPPGTRREFEHEIGAIRLEYAPRSASIYSDLGFILLGFLAADRGEAPLAVRFAEIAGRMGTTTSYGLTQDQRAMAAPTRPMGEDPRRGRLLTGEVHDNYAAALGGVAGHAGLFGSAPAVGVFARALLRTARGATDAALPFTPALVSTFTSRSMVPGSSRAFGWDTMLPTSSCGGRMSRAAFGHVGFTGTSLWIDPARDRYFVLLTNRVCDSGTLEEMRAVRRAFHDALGDV